MFQIDPLLFLEIKEHRVDFLIRKVDFLSRLGASKHNLATRKNEQDYLGLLHLIDEAWEQLGFVMTTRKLLMLLLQ